MKILAEGLSPAQERVMSILEYKKIKIIERKDIVAIIKEYVAVKDIQDLIEKLQKKKRIIPLKKGVYAVVPLSSINMGPLLSEFETIDYLLKENYYIGLYNAFNLHGFTEQIPIKIFVFNTKYSGDKEILQFRIKFFKIKEDKLFGIDNQKYPYSDKERTILDVLEYPQYLGGLNEVLDRVKEEGYNKNKLVDYAIRYDSIKVMKLVGLLTNSQKLYSFLLKKGTLKYYTSLKKTGTKLLDKRWKIRLI